MSDSIRVKVREDLQENFVGFYQHARRRPGDVFSVDSEPRRELGAKEKALIAGNDVAGESYELVKDEAGMVPKAFSFIWMQPVSAAAPEKVSTAQQSMNKRSRVIKEEKAGERQAETGADVL